MLDLARHIVQQKTADFDPSKFDDRYETALVDLINQKRAGTPMKAHGAPRAGTNVVDLMTALKQSLKGDTGTTGATKSKKPAKRQAGQKEMLLPITGKKVPVAAKKNMRPAAAKSRKAG
jgi:DNA end-binding protein Ku